MTDDISSDIYVYVCGTIFCGCLLCSFAFVMCLCIDYFLRVNGCNDCRNRLCDSIFGICECDCCRKNRQIENIA